MSKFNLVSSSSSMAAGPPKLYRAYSVRSKIRAWTCFTAKLGRIPLIPWVDFWNFGTPKPSEIRMQNIAKYVAKWWSWGLISCFSSACFSISCPLRGISRTSPDPRIAYQSLTVTWQQRWLCGLGRSPCYFHESSEIILQASCMHLQLSIACARYPKNIEQQRNVDQSWASK